MPETTTTTTSDRDEVLAAHRDTLRRLRSEAMTTLNRARTEDREPSVTEVVEAEQLLERAGQVADRMRELQDTAGPTPIPVTGPSRPPLVAAARPTDLTVTPETIAQAMDLLRRREQGRVPLTRALPPGGVGLQPTQPRTSGSASARPNRLFDILDTRSSSAWEDTLLSVSAQAPGTPVAPGADKPIAGVVAVGGLARVKQAAYVEFTWEATLAGEDLRSMLGDILVPSLIQAENAAVVTAIDPASTGVPFVDSAASSLLAAIATVNVWGGAGAIILNPADIVTVVGQPTSTQGYAVATDPSMPMLTLWGLPLFFTPAVTVGIGYVVDPMAVAVHVSGPPELIVAWTNLRQNEAAAAIDENAGVGVKRPTGVAKVTLTGVVTAASRSRSRD